MASTSAARLEHELYEKVATLSTVQKREVLDFVTFIATRRRATSKISTPERRTQRTTSIEAIFDIAVDCKDTDLSVNHDKYLYGDDPL